MKINIYFVNYISFISKFLLCFRIKMTTSGSLMQADTKDGKSPDFLVIDIKNRIIFFKQIK